MEYLVHFSVFDINHLIFFYCFPLVLVPLTAPTLKYNCLKTIIKLLLVKLINLESHDSAKSLIFIF